MFSNINLDPRTFISVQYQAMFVADCDTVMCEEICGNYVRQNPCAFHEIEGLVAQKECHDVDEIFIRLASRRVEALYSFDHCPMAFAHRL